MPPAQSQRTSALSPAVNITRKAVAAIKVAIIASQRRQSAAFMFMKGLRMLARVMAWPGW